jgi:GNAT superfamily N-acetyltransferase
MTDQPVDLRSSAENLVRRVYHELLVPAFPADELDPELTFMEDVASGDALTLALFDEDGDPVALIAGYPYADVLLIGYLVTRPSLRSRGLGSRLLKLGVERWCDSGRYAFAVAEIDDPAARGGADAYRRLKFYRRNGARLVDRPYLAPRLGPDLTRAHGMLAIVVWWPADSMVEDSLPAAPFVGWLEEYFVAAEGAAPDDDEYRGLIAAYEATPRVATRPILA